MGEGLAWGSKTDRRLESFSLSVRFLPETGTQLEVKRAGNGSSIEVNMRLTTKGVRKTNAGLSNNNNDDNKTHNIGR